MIALSTGNYTKASCLHPALVKQTTPTRMLYSILLRTNEELQPVACGVLFNGERIHT